MLPFLLEWGCGTAARGNDDPAKSPQAGGNLRGHLISSPLLILHTEREMSAANAAREQSDPALMRRPRGAARAAVPRGTAV